MHPSSFTARRTIAVLLCAGQGTRMGAAQNKVFLPLAGKPLLVHSVEAFIRAAEVDEIMLVAHPAEVERCRSEIVAAYHLEAVRKVIPGGATRHQSEENALAALRSEIAAGRIDVVLIHDAARPFVTPREIDALVITARTSGAALLATPIMEDEIVAQLAPDGTVTRLYATDEIWRAQTPQAFDAHLLLRAYDRAHADSFEGTDTASSIERLGIPVQIIQGGEENFKLTTPQDFLRAEALLHHPSPT